MYVKGVGPARAALLEAKGIATVEDLLAYAPFRYEDRSNLKPVARLAPGEMATVIATVRSARLSGFHRRDLGMFEVMLDDASGRQLQAKWFHAAYLEGILRPGLKVAVYGKVEWDSYGGGLSMMHPEFEILAGEEDQGEASLHVGRIVPIYEAAGKITARIFRKLIHNALGALETIEDPLPEQVRRRRGLLERRAALERLHFPPQEEDLRLLNAFRSPAQLRVIFEEFFWLECGLALKRRRARREPGIAFELSARARERIKMMLPFKPTAAQKRVLGEIARDMAAPHPMNRLLQGDVGSGKTLVAAQAAVIAVESGYQVAMLAPTEILATQHFLYLKDLFVPLGYRVALVTGSAGPSERRDAKRLLADGAAQVVVGTHALLEEDVGFHRLGLAIVDEQHRFGVMQRLRLMRKGVSPDVLIMTATPIPRTLALTLYGDLEVSLLDELPPGRKPVKTRHVTEDQIELVYSFLKRQVDRGRQAYVVYPVIEESETQALKAARKMHRHLAEAVFPGLPVGLLHGRLSAGEKEAVMRGFKRGDIKILVATTVIEVGVDAPNATVMVIEQAERYGLAQLHQLRGRVGRGAGQSYCILVTEKLSPAAEERIRTLVDSNDGFQIAEMDLRLRGPGEFFGTRQSGLPDLRMAKLSDVALLETARKEAIRLFEIDPGLKRPEHRLLAHELARVWPRAAEWS